MDKKQIHKTVFAVLLFSCAIFLNGCLDPTYDFWAGLMDSGTSDAGLDGGQQ